MKHANISKDLAKLQKLLTKTQQTQENSPSLIKKVKRLYHKLFRYFSTDKVKKLALGSAAALLLQGNVYAQTFSSSVQLDPYGLNASKALNNRPEFVDIDNDGDKDIIYYNRGNGKLQYIPNTSTGNAASYGALQTNPFNFATNLISNQGGRGGYSAFADLDNDGDFDFIYYAYDGNGYGYGKVGDFMYYENKGTATSPNFNTLATDPFNLADVPNNTIDNMDLVDLDGDGDFDILVHTYNGVNYALDYYYYENTGTISAPSFTTPVLNPFSLPSSNNFQFLDIDKDGDLDFFYTTNSTTFKYIPNTGTSTVPNFSSTAQSSPFGLSIQAGNVYFAFGEIYKNGKLDFFQESSTNKVYVQLNTTQYTSTEKIQNQNLDINIYPTPSHDLVNIKLGKQDDYTLEVFNLQGQQLKTENIQQATQHQLNLSELASGQYLLRISNADTYTTKQLIKQ
ncbi:MAG: T9SS type A sorting domain-containing protein [Aureispira sp.]|nr:T9SS type A sorting domain-containing protein [Aureispira sp.]